MLDFKHIIDEENDQEWIETSMQGKPMLTTPQLNKGTAFSEYEREIFGLKGKLPNQVETLQDQVSRAYQQFHSYKGNLKRNIYLNNLHDKNQVLFYRLVSEHMLEMIPVLYTPIVGTAVKQFSLEFRQPRGLYISYNDMGKIEQILDNRSNPEIDLVVVTDGEGVLGIGDQGVGGMDIPVAKLMVYTLCGGINPLKTLPILLDVGTNNQELLNDPMYLGWRHERIRGRDYDDFISEFVHAIRTKFPNLFLHWEDFGRENARRNLERYQEKICTFNDDMQGTGVVTLAALLAAVNASKTKLSGHRIVVFGAGTAGTGIADQICDAMVRDGLTEEEAYEQFWLIDRYGLLVDDMDSLTDFQKPYARKRTESADWQGLSGKEISLQQVVDNVKPTVLIGCSAQFESFTQEIIEKMSGHCENPIIFVLSNPDTKVEAHPENLIKWSKGKALIATGSPFDDFEYDGRTISTAQCNNALVFPGIGLGVIAGKARRLTDDMLWAACQALSSYAPINNDPFAPLLPSIAQAREAAQHIAKAVILQGINEGHIDEMTEQEIEEAIAENVWEPHYMQMRKKEAE